MSLIINQNGSSLDEANGNVITMGSTTTTATTNNFRNISNNNNNDEDSASSNYTDPEQNDSAPTELLAEFLTSIMQKNYANALKYCKMILEYEPNNKNAKDLYPQLLMRVNQQKLQSSTSSSSDENCNYTSSLEVVDNEILDNDNIYDDYSDESSSLSNSTTNNSMDLNSYSDEDAIISQQNDQDDLINQLSYSSNSSSKSDPFPESQSSSESIDHRMISPSFSFTSLLLEESDEINGNACHEIEKSSSSQPESSQEQQQSRDNVSNVASPTLSPPLTLPPPPPSSSSPFTSKIVNMIRRKLN